MSDLADLFARTSVPMLRRHHGDDVVHWPRGNSANAETIQAIVDRTNQTSEGAAIEGANTTKIFGYLTLSILKTVTITIDEKGTDTSQITLDGKQWFAQKLLGEDEGSGGFRHYQFMRAIPIATARTPGR